MQSIAMSAAARVPSTGQQWRTNGGSVGRRCDARCRSVQRLCQNGTGAVATSFRQASAHASQVLPEQIAEAAKTLRRLIYSSFSADLPAIIASSWKAELAHERSERHVVVGRHWRLRDWGLTPRVESKRVDAFAEMSDAELDAYLQGKASMDNVEH